MAGYRKHQHLPRLSEGHYLGQAYVHWIMTIHQRRTGWLIPVFYYKFRELLTHAMFRYRLVCPVYCCMPDHLHLLWIGIDDESDQRRAVKFLRKQLRPILEKLGSRLQRQPFDHVLREEEREREAFEQVAEYIAQNPQRAGIVPDFREYPFTGNLVPGYPEIRLFQTDYWERFWRIYSYICRHGLNHRRASSVSDP